MVRGREVKSILNGCFFLLRFVGWNKRLLFLLFMIKITILLVLFHKLFVCSKCYNFAFFDKVYCIAILNCAKSMCNCDNCMIFFEDVHIVHNFFLTNII